jgi:hypothetical protein
MGMSKQSFGRGLNRDQYELRGGLPDPKEYMGSLRTLADVADFLDSIAPVAGPDATEGARIIRENLAGA